MLNRNNTNVGAITTFAAVGIGNWFDNDSRGLCIKLSADALKRDSDGGVENEIDPATECSIVADSAVSASAPAGATFGGIADGSWFTDFSRGLCLKLSADALKRMSDGQVESGIPGDREVVPKADADVTGSYDP